MAFERRRLLFWLGTLAVAASFCLASVEAFAGHTDDGCQVELHCFACHWAFASTGVAALPVLHGPPLEWRGDVAPLQAPVPADAPSPSPTSRGPPAA